jgi:probable phosphoglycerate mutase
MTLLYLIRHGRSEWNAANRVQGQADPPLDDVGQQQARALAEHLRGTVFAAIYASPLLRARATAEAIAAERETPLTLDARLRERHMGEWTGQTGDDLNARYGHSTHHPDWRIAGPPGGEGQAALIARMAAVMDEILAAHAEDTVAVVSHGGALNAYLRYALGVPLEKHVSISFENTAYARVQISEGRVRLLSVGEAPHRSSI